MRKTLFAAVLALGALSCRIPYPDSPAYHPESLGGDPARRELTRPEDLPPAAPVPPPSATMTLDDCLRTALQNNRRVWIADRRILITKDRIDEALSQLLPRLTADAAVTWRNNDQGFSAMGMEIVMGERTRSTARLGLIVPIYDFGRAQAQMGAEGHRVEAVEKEAERSLQELSFAISVAYFRLLEARKIRDVVQESIRLVTLQSRIAQDFLSQGLVARSDVLSAEVQLADRQQTLIRAENNIRLARATLNRLMGVDLQRPTELVDVFEALPWNGPLETALKLAIDRRPDLAAFRRMVEVGRAEYDVIRRGNLPGIVGVAGYNYTSDEATINKDWMDASVLLQIPLVDGFNTQFRLKRKKKEIAEAIDFHDEKLDDILLDVNLAWLQVRDSAERLPVARKSIDLAEENLRVMRDQYVAGLVSTADMLIEEDRLSQARSNHIRALYDCHSSAARLVNATGGPLPKEQP